MESHHFDCQCSRFGHIVRFTVDRQDGSLYLDYKLNNYNSWYKRLKTAIMYLFGSHCEQYDVTVFKQEDYDKLKDVINKASLAKLASASRLRAKY